MARATPSLLALLGLAAVAGYQNRAKLSEMLTDARQRPGNTSATATPNLDGNVLGNFLSDIGRMFTSSTAGTTLTSGLGELVGRFTASGQSETAQSWVSSGPNMPVDIDQLAAALGPETLDELTQKTGLSRGELLLRLNTALPQVVDRFSPEGRLPTDHEAHAFY